MEESQSNDGNEKRSGDKISPKFTRPKLPKFGSHTIGHHYRHKTDPGQGMEIKHFMDELKNWKESNVLDPSMRPKVIKTQTIPKAHSTQTSPRTSPPPGSPNFAHRSSSLNRNRSRSLKLLTDKLKSPRGGPKDSSSSGSGKSKKDKKASDDVFYKPKSADSALSNEPSYPDSEGACGPKRETVSVGDIDTEKTSLVEPIPEKDEREDEEAEKCDKESISSGDNAEGPEKAGPKVESQSSRDSPRLGEEEGTSMSDSDTPSTHVSTYTLHPIDRNSEFLRLRQTAPPKRRPGYAGLPLPKTKIPPLLKYQQDECKDAGGDDNPPVKRVSADESAVKKPNRLDLSGFSSLRKLSTPVFPTRNKEKEEGKLDLGGHNIFRTPSTDSPPALPGCETRLPDDEPVDESVDESDKVEDQEDISDTTDEVITKPVAIETEKPERRNGRSPKQKSKSDPSGNKSFDFDVASVINASQSHSFPLLQKDAMEGSISEIAEDENVAKVEEENNELDVNEDVLNNNETSVEDDMRVINDVCEGESEEPSDDVIFTPQSSSSEPFDYSGSDSMTQSLGSEGLQRMESGGMSPVQEQEGDEGINLACSVYSGGSESSTSTPISYSPIGTLERQNNLLNVPSPKRPILRSVSSASVLQRERKLSGGNNKDKDSRKHSLTTVEDGAQSDSGNKSMEFLPIGDHGNIMASSMPSVWNSDRLPSVSPERDVQYVKVRHC